MDATAKAIIILDIIAIICYSISITCFVNMLIVNKKTTRNI